MSDVNLLADDEQEKGFKGYYLKIGECDFTTPAIKREGFKILPKLVQVTDEQRVASGKLVIKVYWIYSGEVIKIHVAGVNR